ncbi:hypothetical protein WJX72_010068 [[Myrmecia] bisecta]|uniref:Uncharacterized protein n=1 Tax=[Myrmecia] bisecta TaxID=41462 RepID=A0AAW1QG26_9CHLO
MGIMQTRQPNLCATTSQRPFLQPLRSQALWSRGYRLAAPLKVLPAATTADTKGGDTMADTQGGGSPPQPPPNRPTDQGAATTADTKGGATTATTQGGGSPPQPPPNHPTDQDPKPFGLQFEAYVLAWTRDWYGTVSKLLVGACAVAAAVEKATEWFFKTSQAATKQNVLSWTGDSRVITKGDLSAAFAEATSVQKGAARLVLKSDLDEGLDGLGMRLDGLGTRLDGRLDGLGTRLDCMFWCSFLGSSLVHGVTLWAIFKKK